MRWLKRLFGRKAKPAARTEPKFVEGVPIPRAWPKPPPPAKKAYVREDSKPPEIRYYGVDIGNELSFAAQSDHRRMEPVDTFVPSGGNFGGGGASGSFDDSPSSPSSDVSSTDCSPSSD